MRPNLLGLFGALTLTGMTLGVAWVFMREPPLPPPPALQTMLNHPTTELGGEDTAEYSRSHYRNPDGRLVKTTIVFRDGDAGIITYAAHGTVQTYNRYFDTGVLRETRRYDVTAAFVIEGHEIRRDGTLLWETSSPSATQVVHVLYWRDGKTAYLRLVSDKTTNSVEKQIFSSQGLPLSRQKSQLIGGKLLEEDVYDAAGTITRSTRIDYEAKLASVQYYRQDGTLHYVRHLAENYYFRHHGDNGPKIIRLPVREGWWLATTDVFADDGKERLVEYEFDNGAPVVTGTVRQFADGVTYKCRYDSLGELRSSVRNGGGNPLTDTRRCGQNIASAVTTDYAEEGIPAVVDPRADWDKMEAAD